MDPGYERDTNTLGTALGLRQRLASRSLTLGSAFRNKSRTKVREAGLGSGRLGCKAIVKEPPADPMGTSGMGWSFRDVLNQGWGWGLCTPPWTSHRTLAAPGRGITLD